MEYAELGDLLTYLKTECAFPLQYVRVGSDGLMVEQSAPKVEDNANLMMFAWQISKGMGHLEMHRVIMSCQVVLSDLKYIQIFYMLYWLSIIILHTQCTIISTCRSSTGTLPLEIVFLPKVQSLKSQILVFLKTHTSLAIIKEFKRLVQILDCGHCSI